MKKHLILGLTLLIATNILVLSGVAYNRSNEATSHLILTERELSLPYNFASNSAKNKENSGLSLSLKWRRPSKSTAPYSYYNYDGINISKEKLISLGFNSQVPVNRYQNNSKELYWAFELDGTLHKKELIKAKAKYQKVLSAYQEQPNKENEREKHRAQEELDREKISKSRLFYLDISNNFNVLKNKYKNQENILIVKGITKLYYDNDDNSYSLTLKHLSISNIMIPHQHSAIFSKLNAISHTTVVPPRYTVEVKWGSRLEPWVISAKRLTK